MKYWSLDEDIVVANKIYDLTLGEITIRCSAIPITYQEHYGLLGHAIELEPRCLSIWYR